MSEQKTGRLAILTATIAVVVLVAFGTFVLFMIGQRGADDVAWSRLAWLFASVEAIAFGAAGAIFGSSIQRERAVKAEEEARKNADEAAKGRALAETIKLDDPSPGTAGLESTAAADDRTAARHAALARKLFP